MQSLFRPEAVSHQRTQWLGSVLLTRPLSSWLLTGVAACMAVALVAFGVLGHYTRKVRVVGVLAPELGIVRLVAPQPGRIVERLASEGQAVQAGQVLFVLTVDRSTPDGDTEDAVRATLAERRRSLEATQRQQQDLHRQARDTLDRRLRALRVEQAQRQAEAALQRERIGLAETALGRLESLQQQTFVSPAQTQAKAEEVLALKAQLQALERQTAADARSIADLSAELAALPTQQAVERGRLDREIAALDQQAAESQSRQRLVVRAPQDGTVSAVLAETGQTALPGVALANLVPAPARLRADLYVPSSAIGLLRTAQPVALRYDAFPYQRYGHQPGHVASVARTPLQASELAALPLPGALSGNVVGADTEPLYRVTVALDRQTVPVDGRDEPLAAGMQLQADVLLERRRLIEWLFEPLIGFARRV